MWWYIFKHNSSKTIYVFQTNIFTFGLLFPIFYLIEDRSPSRERYLLKHTSAKTIYLNRISAGTKILIFILYKYMFYDDIGLNIYILTNVHKKYVFKPIKKASAILLYIQKYLDHYCIFKPMSDMCTIYLNICCYILKSIFSLTVYYNLT